MKTQESKKLENLTNNPGDFWDIIKTKYPKSFQEFNMWFNEYKKDNCWDNIFNSGYHISREEYTQSPELYELPTALQLGILMQFYASISAEMEDFMPSMKQCIYDYFSESEKYS